MITEGRGLWPYVRGMTPPAPLLTAATAPDEIFVECPMCIEMLEPTGVRASWVALR